MKVYKTGNIQNFTSMYRRIEREKKKDSLQFVCKYYEKQERIYSNIKFYLFKILYGNSLTAYTYMINAKSGVIMQSNGILQVIESEIIQILQLEMRRTL